MLIRTRLVPLRLLAVLAAAAVGSAAHATTVYNNNFEGNSTAGFSGVTTITEAPNSSTAFLGLLGAGTSSTLTLNTAGLTSLTLNYDLYAIMTLDGDGPFGGNSPQNPDAFIVNVGSTTISDYSYANFSGDTQNFEAQDLPPTPGQPDQTGATAVNTLGYGNSGDATYHFSYTFAPTGATTTITFIGDSNQSLGDEGFGIDNVNVTGVQSQTGGVPEPASWALMIAGFGLAGATMRLRRASAIAA